MLLTRLRHETRAAHETIERDLDLLSDRLTLGRYATVLARFHAFLGAWEPLVSATLADEAFFAPRRKLPMIERDLAALGVPLPTPAAIRLPPLGDLPRAMGSLYVLEGSTLGGQLIVRHVRERLGLDGAGTAFFGSYGREVGRCWQAFRERLERVVSPLGHDAAVESANATFACLAEALAGGRAFRAPAGAALQEARHV